MEEVVGAGVVVIHQLGHQVGRVLGSVDRDSLEDNEQGIGNRLGLAQQAGLKALLAVGVGETDVKSWRWGQ